MAAATQKLTYWQQCYLCVSTSSCRTFWLLPVLVFTRRCLCVSMQQPTSLCVSMQQPTILPVHLNSWSRALHHSLPLRIQQFLRCNMVQSWRGCQVHYRHQRQVHYRHQHKMQHTVNKHSAGLIASHLWVALISFGFILAEPHPTKQQASQQLAPNSKQLQLQSNAGPSPPLLSITSAPLRSST